MNYLDAHKIITDYINTVASKHDGLFRSEKTLKNSKLDIIQAYKLFVAHMFAFDSHNQDFYEKLNIIVTTIGDFANNDLVAEYEQCQKLLSKNHLLKSLFHNDKLEQVKNRSNELIDNICSSTIESNSKISNEISNYDELITKEAIQFKNKITEIQNDQSIESSTKTKLKNDLINNYCKKAYEIANIKMDDDDWMFFYPFDVLKQACNNKRFDSYFNKYKYYIYSNGYD